MTTGHKWISSLAVAAAVSLTSFPSSATEPAVHDAPTRTVKAWDLDLANLTDVETLYERVQEAASDVCRAEVRRHWNTTRRAPPMGWTEQCVADALNGVVRDVPLLGQLRARERIVRND
jgi:UrcA family protein